MSDIREFHLPITTDGVKAVDCLSDATGLSKQQLKHMMQKGCVWLEQSAGPRQTEKVPANAYYAVPESIETKQANRQFIQRVRRAKKVLKAGDTLHCYYNPDVLSLKPQPAQLISDRGDYSVWNKPGGMLSQGSKWGDHCTLYRWAEQQLKPERPAFIVHRLDRAASGLMILAHKKSIASAFSILFEQRQIEKHYRVWVEGDFRSMLPPQAKVKTLRDDIAGKSACSHVEVMEYHSAKHQSLLDVSIETGRKHQIRIHLAGAGFPVVGDRLYGQGPHTVDLQLQAASLQFTCPSTGEPVAFSIDSEAPLQAQGT